MHMNDMLKIDTIVFEIISCLKHPGSVRVKVSTPSFYLDQMKITTVKQCRHLGITISTQNCDIDLKGQMRKLYANVNLLLRKFSK